MLRRAALAAITAMALLLAGCSSPTPLSDTPPNEYSGLDIPAGRIDKSVGKLDGLAAALMAESHIPGMAIAVIHGGETLYAKGFGVRNVTYGEGRPVDADTVFQLASLSTAVGATVIAHEVTENVVDWDTPLQVFLPWFALADPYVSAHVTIADLYAQRSGLPARAGDRLKDLGYDRRQVLQRLRHLPLSPFRITHADTNFGLTAAAEAVAAAARKPWEELCAEALYGPLQMNSTSSRYTDYTRSINRATAHVRSDNGYRPRYRGDHDVDSPAAGVSSSANDMARWLTMVLADGSYAGKRIVSPEALTPAVTAQTIADPATAPSARAGFHGYGFQAGITSSGRTLYGRSGGSPFGTSSAFAMLPSADLGIIVLTNAEPVGVPETLISQFLDLVQYDEIRQDWGRIYRQDPAANAPPKGALSEKEPPAQPVPAGPLRGYTGEYANEFWGSATVTERPGGLELSLGPRRQKLPLTHWEGDTFTFTPEGENVAPGTISKATFTPDTLTLEYYDNDKLGMFFR